MWTVLNPAMLWGLTALAVPLLIHLLLRQRPRPRPWAAMRWLAAAQRAVQRRYRLTNILLLLLRCLALMLLVVALARPLIQGLGQKDDWVLLVDISASMGPTADENPLAALAARLDGLDLRARRFTVISFGKNIQLRHQGSVAEGIRLLSRIEVDNAVGGLDDILEGEGPAELLRLLPPSSALVLASDFRQDSAAGLSEFLEEQGFPVHRLRLGRDGANALVTDLSLDQDLVVGEPTSLAIRIQGEATALRVRVGEGSPVQVNLSQADDGWQQVILPPLLPGEHRVHLELEDRGLAYDNSLEYPLRVRDRLSVLVIGEEDGVIGTALAADPLRVDHQRINPLALEVTPLPEEGLVVLREALPDSQPLLEWVQGGGVLWVDWELLQRDPHLVAALQGRVGPLSEQPGGRLRSGFADLNESFSRIRMEGLAALNPEDDALEVLLRAGEAPLVLAGPLVQGLIIVQAPELERSPIFRTAGPVPEWVLRVARSQTQSLYRIPHMEAGSRAQEDLHLERDGDSRTFARGEAIQLRPGLWTRIEEDGRRSQLLILANRDEGRLQVHPQAEDWRDVDLFRDDYWGQDWGYQLLIVALVALLLEGSLAAWAGRMYGR